MPAYDNERRLVQLLDAEPSVAAYPEEASQRLWERHTFGVLLLMARLRPTERPHRAASSRSTRSETGAGRARSVRTNAVVCQGKQACAGSRSNARTTYCAARS